MYLQEYPPNCYSDPIHNDHYNKHIVPVDMYNINAIQLISMLIGGS